MWAPVIIHVRNDEGVNVAVALKREKERNSEDIKKVEETEGDSYQRDVLTERRVLLDD